MSIKEFETLITEIKFQVMEGNEDGVNVVKYSLLRLMDASREANKKGFAIMKAYILNHW